jgi:adenylate kinase
MKVIIGGIPGVGKTTVLNVLIKSGILVENYGDVMLKEAVRMNYVKNRDDLRRLPIDIQKNIQKKASEYLSGLSSIVIDTHFSIQTPGGFLPGLPPDVLQILKPDLFISIEADPLEVFERRKNDQQRNRDDDSLDKIRRHMEVNRAYGISYSAMTGSPIMIVMNENGKHEEAAHQIIRVIGGK